MGEGEAPRAFVGVVEQFVEDWFNLRSSPDHEWTSHCFRMTYSQRSNHTFSDDIMRTMLVSSAKPSTHFSSYRWKVTTEH